MKHNIIAVLDIETTGFINEGGLIVEIGIVELNLSDGSSNVVYDELVKEESFCVNHKNSWIFQNSSLTFGEVMNAEPLNINTLQNILNNYIADNDCVIYLHAYGRGHVFNTVVAENSIINSEYGIFLASDFQPAELNLNNITKNLIKDNNECGIHLNNTYNNSISNNNFIFNKRTTYFENSYNTWNNNYWNRPRLLPYLIFGKTDSDLSIEWDQHPRLLPNTTWRDS